MAKRKSEPSLFDDSSDDTPPAAPPPPPSEGGTGSGMSGDGSGAVALHDAAQSRYLNYALSVITSRALPDVRDGLKPVQRRILLHDVAAEPHRRRQAPQVRQGRRRRDGQLPPARRLGALRGAGPHGPAVLAALSAGRRLGQLRLARRRSGGGDALHRVPAGPHLGRDPPGDRPGDGPVPAQLRRHQDRAGGAAVAHPQPARQRRHRHRGGDGHQHPAAQPHRGVPGARSSCSTTPICRWRSCAAG